MSGSRRRPGRAARTGRRSRRWPVALAIGLVAGLAAAGVWRWRTSRSHAGTARPAPTVPVHTAAYVGSEACAGCHRVAYDAWQASQHAAAMTAPTAATVAGAFDGRSFRHGAVATTFSQHDGQYWVRTDDADGALREFPVRDTFGVFPLQQYLLEQPGGRLQALSIAWDSRPKAAGGQRWFSLYPDETIDHTDPLHWTGRAQNWNFMCADCHSTNVRKGYDAASNTFRTTWSALNVSCESCHGPGSAHVAWAGRSPRDTGAAAADNGLTVHLTERTGVQWTVDAASGHPVRSTPRTSSREIQVCAVCHSRRAQFADGYVAGDPLGDFYEPATLQPGLYFPDGQQRDEVYVYASFLQSRMANAGVTCSDCHEPHSGRVRRAGNALCTTCHVAARYDRPAHHHHAAGSPGAACVACHMPARTYMQIDARRDHSLRVPRPDLTPATGSPNACNDCHRDRTPDWAARAIRGWVGHDPAGFQDFATAFHAFDTHRPGSAAAVARVATSPTEPAIVRASALERLATAAGSAGVAASALGDADPMVRAAALRVFDAVAPAGRVSRLAPLLRDPIRSVRILAARQLAPAAGQLSAADRPAFDRAADELVAAERFNADRPEHRVSLGVFFADLGRVDDAEREYRGAIALAPDFAPAYVNLAELLRARGDEPAAEATLRSGAARLPANADLQYALGLSLTRSHRAADALAAFAQAAALGPAEVRFRYAYALALNGAGQSAAAIRELGNALTLQPDNRDVLLALAAIERDTGRVDDARRHAGQLLALDPQDRDAQALVDELRRAPQ
jgi:Flp pilus assembly protein TadD